MISSMYETPHQAKIWRNLILPLMLFFLWACAVPRVGIKVVQPSNLIQNEAINEASGIVKSKQFNGVFWIHNDSGDIPRIFAVDCEGNSIAEYPVQPAEHVDWEDITTDSDGNLYIGDFGNNWHVRKDFKIYVLEEQNPQKDSEATVKAVIPFRYPDQGKFGATLHMNFDAEALFYFRDTLWLLTKHLFNSKTKLYQFPSSINGKEIQLEKVDSFDVDGMVTGSDVNSTGEYLAVLTYNDIWIFYLAEQGNKLLSGKVKRIPIALKQCEGICWDGNELVVVNEEGEIYRVNPDTGDW